MQRELYNPFTKFDFRYRNCFITGLTEPQPITVGILPDWLLEAANFSGDEQLKLLDESIQSYSSLKIPCNEMVFNTSIAALEQKVKKAFENGFVGVTNLPVIDLYNWLTKFLYGFIYIEMNAAIQQNQLSADGINMGQGLMHKFGNLHTMMQGITQTVSYDGFKPWSLLVVELEDADTPFSFRDEINTMTISMKFKNFGIIACLQDNGVNEKYHQELLGSIKNKQVSAQQFEELCARFYYSAYLFNRLPEYTIMPLEDAVYIEAMPLRGTLNKAIFDVWQHKIYAQVLENFWKPWGHLVFEIIKDPTTPMSYFEPHFLPEAG